MNDFKEKPEGYEYNDDLNVLVVYCAKCGTDTGIATRITRQNALNDMKYICRCGDRRSCGQGIIKMENKLAWQNRSMN